MSLYGGVPALKLNQLTYNAETVQSDSRQTAYYVRRMYCQCLRPVINSYMLWRPYTTSFGNWGCIILLRESLGVHSMSSQSRQVSDIKFDFSVKPFVVLLMW